MAASNRLRTLAPRQTEPRSPFAGGFLLSALATLAVGAGLVVAVFHWRAPAPEAAEAVLSATAPRGPAQPALLPVDDGEWSDGDIRRCSDEANAAADTAAARKLAAVSADRVGLGAPEPAFVKRSAYLLCNARSKPLHLCRDYWHGWLVEAVRAYAADFRSVSASAYWTKVNLAERARSDARADGAALKAAADDIDQTTREVARRHEEITAALRALVTDGILAPEEFAVFLGYGIPTDIRALLGDARALRKACS
jgi:hypothetical protein